MTVAAKEPERMLGYKVHPLCAMLPKMDEEDFNRLRESIRRHPEDVHVVLYGIDGEQQIIDGRHRAAVCEELQIEPHKDLLPGRSDSELAWWVLERNFNRRHLTSSQKAALVVESGAFLAAVEAAEVLKTAAENNQPAEVDEETKEVKIEGETVVSTQDTMLKVLAAKAGTNMHYLYDAKKIHDTSRDLFEKVKSGEIALHAAKKMLSETVDPNEATDKQGSAVKDETGQPVHGILATVFDKKKLFADAVRALEAAMARCKALGDDQDVSKFFHADAVLGHLRSAIKEVHFATPHAICPDCKGTGVSEETGQPCERCRSAGWVNQSLLKVKAPQGSQKPNGKPATEQAAKPVEQVNGAAPKTKKKTVKKAEPVEAIAEDGEILTDPVDEEINDPVLVLEKDANKDMEQYE